MAKYHAVRRLVPMGQWQSGKHLAECLELEDFGIIGAVIDTEGNSIIMNRALAYQDLLAACEYVVQFLGDDYPQLTLKKRLQSVIAKAEVGAP